MLTDTALTFRRIEGSIDARFDLRLSPVRDETGAVRGVYATAIKHEAALASELEAITTEIADCSVSRTGPSCRIPGVAVMIRRLPPPASRLNRYWRASASPNTSRPQP